MGCAVMYSEVSLQQVLLLLQHQQEHGRMPAAAFSSWKLAEDVHMLAYHLLQDQVQGDPQESYLQELLMQGLLGDSGEVYQSGVRHNKKR